MRQIKMPNVVTYDICGRVRNRRRSIGKRSDGRKGWKVNEEQFMGGEGKQDRAG